MRISLHIVVALLLIALIYREILKGILPPVCGNNWQGTLCLIHGSVHLYSRLICKSIYIHVTFLLKHRSSMLLLEISV